MDKLNLTSGKWLVSDCSKYPSDNNCKLVIMAPADQRDNLIDEGVHHMIAHHGHEDKPELREEMAKSIEEVDV